MGDFFRTVAGFVTENQGPLLALAASAVVVFGLIAQRTANKTDDKIFNVLKRWLRIP